MRLVPAATISILAIIVAGALAADAGKSSSADKSSQEARPPNGYDLVPSFTEDFDGGTLDTKTWTNVFAPRSLSNAPIVKRSLWANGELQVYFDRDYLNLGIDPFRVANGTLTITAQRLDPGAQQAVLADLSLQRADFQQSALKNVSYSSGVISSRDRFSQKYGYFEMRARWSTGRGIWPAFWLLPKSGGWPPEIDILEAHGDKPDTAFQSTHSHHEPKAVTRTVRFDSVGPRYHRYGALWLPDRIDYYIDGQKTASIPTSPDMTEEMYMIVNLAIGGYWPGNPAADAQFPVTMDIDYVRAWRFLKLPTSP